MKFTIFTVAPTPVCVFGREFILFLFFLIVCIRYFLSFLLVYLTYFKI